MQDSKYSDMTVSELGGTLWRRKSALGAICLICICIGTAVTALTKPSYESFGTLLVHRENSGSLDLNSFSGGSQSDGDALNQDINMQTEASILRSDTLALNVIRMLRLGQTPDFRYTGHDGLLYRLFSPRDVEGEMGQLSPQESTALQVFQKNLTVTPQPGTKLIRVTFLNSNPQQAAQIVNALMVQLIDHENETRLAATDNASGALSKQLTELKAHSQALQEQVARLQLEAGVYNMGTTDPEGRPQTYSEVMDQFQRAAHTLSEAEQNMELKRSIYLAAQSNDGDAISSLAGNSVSTMPSPGISNALNTLQVLRAQQGTLQGQVAELKIKFGPKYPKLAELQGNLAGIDSAITQEIARIRKSAKSDYEVSQQTLLVDQQVFDREKGLADAANKKDAEYFLTKQEADESRTLYETLLRRVKEADVLRGLKPNSIDVVDTALAPRSPKKPNIPIYLLGSLGAGLFLGGFYVLVSESLDDKVHNFGSLQAVGVPVFDHLPGTDSLLDSGRLPEASSSNYEEAVRMLRYKMSGISRTQFPKVILVTEVLTQSEQTTLFSCALAGLLARTGNRVLLVEANLRNPLLSLRLDMGKVSELTELLMYPELRIPATPHPSVPGLFTIVAGKSVVGASELLDHPRMHLLISSWVQDFDVVILIAAGILEFADALSLSEVSNACLLLAQRDTTSTAEVREAFELLRQSSTCQTRVVLVDGGHASASNLSLYRNILVKGGAHEPQMV